MTTPVAGSTADVARLPTASRIWLGLGGVQGLLAVAAGAYGRHGAIDPGAREMFAIAAQYQIAHALGLLAVAWLASLAPGRRFGAATVAGVGFSLGTVLFSGSLYAFGITGAVPVEGAAPLGGWLMMLGWLALVWAAVRGRG